MSVVFKSAIVTQRLWIGDNRSATRTILILSIKSFNKSLKLLKTFVWRSESYEFSLISLLFSNL